MLAKALLSSQAQAKAKLVFYSLGRAKAKEVMPQSAPRRLRYKPCQPFLKEIVTSCPVKSFQGVIQHSKHSSTVVEVRVYATKEIFQAPSIFYKNDGYSQGLRIRLGKLANGWAPSRSKVLQVGGWSGSILRTASPGRGNKPVRLVQNYGLADAA